MIDYQDLATRYIAMWNETDADVRAKLVAELCADEARYVDPAAVAEGGQAIAATIGAVQERFAGWTFRLAGPVDGHHDQARFSWTFGPEGVQAPVEGFDVVVADDAGKLVAVCGFLDKVPAA
jgi:hypothetical protein